MLVDAHTHVVPDTLPFGVADERFPWFRADGDAADVLIGARVFRRVRRESWDPEARLRAMDAAGVQVHVVSPMPELLCYWADGDGAETFTRALNRWVADFVGHAPDRLHGLGVLPLQDVDLAVRLAPSLAAAGLRGVLVGSNVNGASIADDTFLPVWQVLEDLGLSVFAHAFHPAHTELFQPRIANAVTFPWEIGFATSAWIGRALPARVPGLRLLASHGGGGAIPTLPRLVDAWDRDEGVRATLGIHPVELARRLWFDSVVFDPRVLELCADIVGADRFVLGSDYPFMPGPCDEPVRRSSLADDDGIAGANAFRWLGIDG